MLVLRPGLCLGGAARITRVGRIAARSYSTRKAAARFYPCCCFCLTENGLRVTEGRPERAQAMAMSANLVLLLPPHGLAHLAILVPGDLFAALLDHTAHRTTSSLRVCPDDCIIAQSGRLVQSTRSAVRARCADAGSVPSAPRSASLPGRARWARGCGRSPPAIPAARSPVRRRCDRGRALVPGR
jgi:hypothetical protein